MDEYSSLAGTSIITPPHGKVSGLAGKRKIGERKKQKKNGKDQGKKEEEDVVIHGRIRDSMTKDDSDFQDGRPLKNTLRDDAAAKEEAPIGYGKRLTRKKKMIDLMI